MRKIAIALIAPLLPSVVHAWTPQPYTRMIGETLLERCRSSDPVYYSNDIGYCRGYISGVLDQLMYNRAAAGLDGCPLASNPTEEQVWDVVINFLVANPTVRNNPADNIVAVAIDKAWGCGTVPAVPPNLLRAKTAR
jgi:Rap1a immunity proteins